MKSWELNGVTITICQGNKLPQSAKPTSASAPANNIENIIVKEDEIQGIENRFAILGK